MSTKFRKSMRTIGKNTYFKRFDSLSDVQVAYKNAVEAMDYPSHDPIKMVEFLRILLSSDTEIYKVFLEEGLDKLNIFYVCYNSDRKERR